MHNNLHDVDSYLAANNTNMMGSIIDCNGGMDKALYDGLKIRSIHPVSTDIQYAQAAVDAYLAGDIINHLEFLY